MFQGQLKSKRDEFWDTAPAFEGKQEIWNALKAAVEATEQSNDYDLAQAILDGAGISMPNGSLVECYDELGTRYAIPVYCLSMPVNLVADADGVGAANGRDTPADESEPVVDMGPEVKLKVRISLTDSDCRMIVHSGQTVLSAKRKLFDQVDKMVEPSRQRWYFGKCQYFISSHPFSSFSHLYILGGKLLSDKMRISDCNIPSGHVVQCVINELVQFDVIQTEKE